VYASDGLSASGFIDANYRHSGLSVNGTSNPTWGARGGVAFSGDADYRPIKSWSIMAVGAYSTANNSWFSVTGSLALHARKMNFARTRKEASHASPAAGVSTAAVFFLTGIVAIVAALALFAPGAWSPLALCDGAQSFCSLWGRMPFMPQAGMCKRSFSCPPS
jgi:hypothetical protein